MLTEETTTEKTLPCGKTLVVNDGVIYVVVRGNTVMRKDQYCMVCHRMSEIEELLKKDDISIERRRSLEDDLANMRMIIPDYKGKLDSCAMQINLATRESFDAKKIYIEDTNDIKILTDYIRKYGFTALIFFMAYYANSSKLGLEWFELIMKESAIQSKRLVQNPECADESSPIYKPVMMLAGNLCKTLEDGEDKYKVDIYG
jgi:hypothetical protein